MSQDLQIDQQKCHQSNLPTKPNFPTFCTTIPQFHQVLTQLTDPLHYYAFCDMLHEDLMASIMKSFADCRVLPNWEFEKVMKFIDSATSSDHNKKRYQYDVFLSFSGEDTRRSFVDHLNNALQGYGIRTFKDDERLEKGKEIKDELLKSIEDSRFCIIIFSKKYASSSWCLDELVKIMECQKTTDQTAFPVFYDVEPTEVRKQSGSVGEAFARHTNKKLGKWRKALKVAANLSGWELKNTADGHEAKVIKLIVERVSLELRSVNMGGDENLVGMDERMQDLDPYLEIGLDDVRMVGIKGMGGAGKTTLARAIFDKLSINFEAKSFVEDVRENSKAPLLGMKKLQEQVLRDVLGDKGITVSSVHEGTNLMKTMLCGKKALIVLDDVDHRDQLEGLAGNTNWFKLGSRIIITTRDEQVLIAHGVKWIHDVNLLLNEEAIRLFRRHAFREDVPTEEYDIESLEVIHYAAGLPLTIKVLGSFLCGKSKPEWIEALARLKTIPLQETLTKLELSYENLEDDYKKIFLDVACFYRHLRMSRPLMGPLVSNNVITMLESRGFKARNGLRVLHQKCLVTVDKKWNLIHMHDHIEEMGKNIVHREHRNDPTKHSRLWVQEEIEYVLANDLGTEATRCIELKITPGIVLESLRNMKKLECLIVHKRKVKNISNDCVKINEAHEYFPNSLRYLHWYGYHHQCFPKTFEANNLVALEMPFSKIKQLWEGGKIMKRLKFLNLSYAEELRSLDLGLTPNLERLNLRSCEKLVALDVHGGCLKTLVYLNLNSCKGLKSISFIERMESLEVLHLCDLDLKEFPDYIITGHSSNSLLELNLSYNEDIKEVPSSIRNLHKLVSLHIAWCSKLKSVPGSIYSLKHLRTLDLSYTGIEELPEELGQLECLENLYLSGTKVKHLPGSICMLKHLKTLYLWGCKYLEKLPEDVGQLESLEKLVVTDCYELREIPHNICKLKGLKKLDLRRCSRLEKLPEELGNLKCLQFLHVQKTGITHLPQSIYSVKGLTIYNPMINDCGEVYTEKLLEDVGQSESLEEKNSTVLL